MLARFTNLHSNLEEGEIIEEPVIADLIVSGRAWAEEWKKGKYLSWGDWCWTEEDDLHIEKTIIHRIKIKKTLPNCCSGGCSFRAHSNPPKHFSQADRAFCCSKCRISGGKHHGGHCEKKPYQ
tara:strand:+ start:5814 stop:6182 length:369 start_codon:yes stop_codon:yes gene_type:complete